MFHQLREQLLRLLTGQSSSEDNPSHLVYCQPAATTSTTDKESNSQESSESQQKQGGILERRRKAKEIRMEKMNRDQDQFTRDAFQKLQTLVQSQEEDMKEAIEGRQKLKEVYNSKKQLAKYRDNLMQRQQRVSTAGIANELYNYTKQFIFNTTDDELIFAYKRKMQKKAQQHLMYYSIQPLLCGAFFYGITRMLKSKRGPDIFYFIVPFLLAEYATLKMHSKVLYELEYPAHPVVNAKRAECINRICYSYPKILKIEIEFLHRKLTERDKKLFEEKQEKSKATEQKAQIEEREPLHFEKVFTLGEVGKDYRNMLKKKRQAQKDAKNRGSSSKETQLDEERPGARFKLIVEEGELFLQCVDKFEDVFEISQEAIEGISVVDCLDPIVVKNHQEIVNAMFEFYYLLQTEYISQYYFQNEPHKDLNIDEILSATKHAQRSNLQVQAEQKLRQQLELTPEDAKRRQESKHGKDPLNSTRNSGSFLAEIMADEGDKHSKKKR